MKLLLSLTLFLYFSISITAQTDGWYLYTKASEITKIIPDDVNTNELHLATDIGYIRYNTASSNVTNVLNITSQNPAIGHVKDIALDPTSGDIALTLKDGIAIYDGLDVTTYYYDNSNLTIGEFTNQFYYLQVEYAKDGSLYIFKEDAFGYQKFNNGVFEPEMTTSFKPQDIVENSSGTKAFFAGDNNGLWELDKAIMSWANYTTSNSDIFQNFLTSLCMDSADNLYMGHYQGIDKLDTNGNFFTCNDTSPIPVFEINISPITGELLVRNSKPNSASIYGMSIVDFASCSWANYNEDGTNCLNENVYDSCSYGGNGLIYTAPQIFSIMEKGKLVEFSASTEGCSDANINYLNAPIAVNSNVITDYAIREKTNGNLEIGFTRSLDFHSVEIDPSSFNGVFPTANTITHSPGEYPISVISDNNYFIIEKDTGWLFMDENNIISEFNHNIPNYFAIVTKKAANYNSDNGIINLVHKGFDASFNYRVYKTQCNTSTGTCAPSEELFTTNRDLTQNILFDVNETSSSDNIHTVGISLDTSVSGISNNNNAQQNSSSLYTEEFWNKNANGAAIIKTVAFLNIILPNKDPLIIRTNTDKINTVAQLSDNKTLRIYREGTNPGELISQDFTIDIDNADGPDEIISSSVYDYYGLPVLVLMVKNNSGIQTVFSQLYEGEEGNLYLNGIFNQQFVGTNNQSDNLTINKILAVTETLQTGSRSQNNDTATIATLTNYGLIIKTNVDVSQLTLSDSDAELSETVLTLFPNPSNDIVTFSINQINSASVFDIKGRRVLEVNSSSFSVKGLAKGVYILRAITANGAAISKKLIKN